MTTKCRESLVIWEIKGKQDEEGNLKSIVLVAACRMKCVQGRNKSEAGCILRKGICGAG